MKEIIHKKISGIIPGKKGTHRKKAYMTRIFASAGTLAFLVLVSGTSCLAASGTPESIIDSQFGVLLNIVIAIVSSYGGILTLWGITEFGTALQSQDGMMQAQAFKRIAGGLVVSLAPQLITLL